VGIKSGGGGVAWVSEFARLYELSRSALSTFFRARIHSLATESSTQLERKIDLRSEFLIKNIHLCMCIYVWVPLWGWKITAACSNFSDCIQTKQLRVGNLYRETFLSE